jgi:hypothetical protein
MACSRISLLFGENNTYIAYICQTKQRNITLNI